MILTGLLGQAAWAPTIAGKAENPMPALPASRRNERLRMLNSSHIIFFWNFQHGRRRQAPSISATAHSKLPKPVIEMDGDRLDPVLADARHAGALGDGCAPPEIHCRRLRCCQRPMQR
jgi:hypothetical protein